MLLKFHDIFKDKYKTYPDQFLVYRSDEEFNNFIENYWMRNKERSYNYKEYNLDLSKENIFLKIKTKIIEPENPIIKTKYYKVIHNGNCIWTSAAHFIDY